jgi:hypothetical protein
MRTFLICSGIHGRLGALEWLRRTVERRRPDGILFAGGVLGPSRRYEPREGTEWGLTRPDALFVERFFATLGRLGRFAAVIPGPFDTPLDEFLRLGMHAEIDHPGLHLAHATLIEHRDVAVCGLGGRLVEEPVAERDTFSTARALYHLRPLWVARQPRKILLLPAPPADGLGGPEGGPVANALVDSLHPTLCVLGGPGPRRGARWVAGTLVVDPGCLADGRAAWLDWSRPPGEQVEFLCRREVEAAAVGN